MPLYSYIPYLDPDIDEKEKKTFSGHIIDTDEELDTPNMENITPKLPLKTPVESFKRKVNENLKNFNSRMSDLLQDGLGCVDNICKQVKGSIRDDAKPIETGNYMEKCATGDILHCCDEKKYNSSVTGLSQDTILLMKYEKIQEFHCNTENSIFAVHKLQENPDTKDDNLPPLSKRMKPHSRPTSKSLKVKKSDPKCSTPRLTSRSFNETMKTSEGKKSSEKIKMPRTKNKKKTVVVEDEKTEPACAKKRLGQIERDYQKVVENLGMVERMMACVNERIMNQKNKGDRNSMEAVGSVEKNCEQSKSKNKMQKSNEQKAKGTKRASSGEFTSNNESEGNESSAKIKGDKKIVDRTSPKETKDVPRRTKKDAKEINQVEEKSESKRKKYVDEELINQFREVDDLNKKTSNDTRSKAEQLRALNPLSRIKINDSLSDIDALIDNAVMELGNLVSSDFDISQGSSDASFKLTSEGGPQTFYDECKLAMSSATSSDSENAIFGEESDKFEISKSFQELKESYVKKLKQETSVKQKKPTKTKGKSPLSAEEDHEVSRKNSFDQLHEEIFNDSSWNKLDPMNFECKFLKNPPTKSNSNVDLSVKTNEEMKVDQNASDKIENSKLKQDLGTEKPNYAVMEALVPTRIENINAEEENEEVITISLPAEKEIKNSSRKARDFVPNIQDVDTEQLDDETLQITVTLKGDSKHNKEENICENTKKPLPALSESELGDFDANRRQERNLRKQQKKKIKDKKSSKPISNKEKVKTPKPQLKEVEDLQPEKETDNANSIDVDKKESAEDTTDDAPKNKIKPKFKKKSKKFTQPTIEILPIGPKDIREIKKLGSNFSEDSSYSSVSSLEDSMFWTKETPKAEEVKPIDPMKQVSIQCKKLIGDLVVEDDVSLQNIMNGYFNSTLIRSLVGRPKRPRSVRIHTPIQDPDLRSIVPEVHRKKAVSDLHERMEFQIRQTDSFDGFLNLMNKTRRKALIKQAERQDHNLRCQMKTCLKKRYPFRVVTASVPPAYDRSKEKKESEKKYINSLWFSPKDFKLRRNSRIFNRKRMEMYCQSLHKGPMIPKCKCGEVTSKEGKKASNYSILVRSGTPLGRRPHTPRRWIQLRPPSAAGGHSQRPRLHHCDILDDLTLKDLAPFNAEYPRNDERNIPDSLQGSLLYKLACGGHKGDADGTLMELVAPKLSCTQNDCKLCRFKSKNDKKPTRKIRSAKKSGDDDSVTSTKTNEIQSLTPKAATQLLIQNIGEIKSKKSSTKSQSSDKNLVKQKDTKSKRSLRKNSRKVLAQDSKSAVHQRMEENLVKKTFFNQHVPILNIVAKATPTKTCVFKGVDQMQKVLKVPELYLRAPGRRSTAAKLFPYINDPENKVFQNITVLPVKVFYDFDPLKNYPEKKTLEEVVEPERPPINITSLSETDELEVSTIENVRPSTAGDRKSKRKMVGRRRIGTPKSPTFVSRQNTNKFVNLPLNPKTRRIDVSLTRKNREIVDVENQDNLSKFSSRRNRYRRSNSLEKSTESDNTGSQCPSKKSSNPNPWKPASRRPRTPKTPLLPKSPIGMRYCEKSNIQNLSKTFSTGRISPRQRSVPETREQTQMQTLVNKEKKLRFEINPMKVFYDIDSTDQKHYKNPKFININSTPSTPIHRCRPLSPSQKVMVDHLHMLRNRNTKLQGNIQKAINIIEEKMVDVLSTNDQSYKKKTIDKMEKEINKVLKMINEQNTNQNRKEDETASSNVRKISSKTDTVRLKQESEEESTTKAFITPAASLKMPKPPKKRSISRIMKFHSRPSTVEEEKSFDIPEELELFKINEGDGSKDETHNCHLEDQKKVEKEMKSKGLELYPSQIASDEGDIPLCPILRCPTPPSFTSLSQKTKSVLRKMSKEAFGKFADVVKTKTRLIIDMTERINVDDGNPLPNPKITSALPAILAGTKLPPITTIHQARTTADLMSTTVSSIMSVHQAPFESILNASADALSAATTEISEFANGCAERSITSFSGSESYTWRKIELSQPMEFQCSACSLKGDISHDLTPFMKALKNLKAGRLFDKRHQLLPIEETSPNFRKLLDFLESLSRVKETFNQTTMRDVQLMWNPEKRCSFHSSIAGSTKLRLRKNSKAISEHSIVLTPTSSFSDLLFHKSIEEKPTDFNYSMDEIKEEREHQNDEQKKRTTIEKTEDILSESKAIYQSIPEIQKNEKQEKVKLVFSEVQLISISNRNIPLKHKKKETTSLDCERTIIMLKDDRYSNFLKFFYLIFYAFVYFCMTAMNFSCKYQESYL